MKALALNCGSSSLKYQLWEINPDNLLARGQVDRIGLEDSNIEHKFNDQKQEDIKHIADHEQAVNEIVLFLEKTNICSLQDIKGVCHRVVQGGSFFKESSLIDEAVIKKIEEFSNLAPLHNPAHVVGIRSAVKIIPEAVQVAVFDTTFHHTMPEHVYTYALPRHILDKYPELRRYGFHGSSHRYVTAKACEYLADPAANLITIHIGNGISLTAIKDGKVWDTSMGLTPLEGVVMGTRSGSIDPTIVQYLAEKEQISLDEVISLLNKSSGLLGVSGRSSDHRDISSGIQEGDHNCQLASDIYDYAMKKQLGAFAFALGHVDAIIFTAGVGENCTEVREAICNDLLEYGIELDQKKNTQARGSFAEISTENSRIKVLVIPTNEEYVMIQDTKIFMEA